MKGAVYFVLGMLFGILACTYGHKVEADQRRAAQWTKWCEDKPAVLGTDC